MAYPSRSRVYKQSVKNTHGVYISGFWLKKPSVSIVVLSGIKLVAGTTSAGLRKAFF